MTAQWWTRKRTANFRMPAIRRFAVNERIILNASFEAIMGAWLTTSRGFVTMAVMQILNSTSMVAITKYLSRRKD